MEVRTIASARASRLMVVHYTGWMQKLGLVLTSIDSSARPYFFETMVIQFVQAGLTFSVGRSKIRIPDSQAIQVLKDSMNRAGVFRLLPRQFCVPIERTFPVIDAWSAYCLVQVTVAKRHALDWTNRIFKNVLSQVKEARRRNNIPGKIPFLFFVPDGQTCKTLEKGTPDPEVAVYVVGLSNLPDWTTAAYENLGEEVPMQNEGVDGYQTITVPTSMNCAPHGRTVVSVLWEEFSVRRIGHHT
eukprot:gb/GECG01008689.1/.p1 GENE.gb/GECG01008689.1/~~gb/GECG01008689.1/.p1  ORF type:complete len:243 (+),score=7.73 gb/GECG01008689.1/:1-729(+)